MRMPRLGTVHSCLQNCFSCLCFFWVVYFSFLQCFCMSLLLLLLWFFLLLLLVFLLFLRLLLAIASFIPSISASSTTAPTALICAGEPQPCTRISCRPRLPPRLHHERSTAAERTHMPNAHTPIARDATACPRHDQPTAAPQTGQLQPDD